MKTQFPADSLATKIMNSPRSDWPVVTTPIDDGPWPAPLDQFLAGVCEGAPYLRRLMEKLDARFTHLLSSPAETLIETILEETASLDIQNEAELKVRLRVAKQEIAICLGLMDISGILIDSEVMIYLSKFADIVVEKSFQASFFILAQNPRNYLDLEKCLSTETGITIIAMGKHGAYELNYSSDIDFVVIYDDTKLPYITGKENDAKLAPQQLAVKITQLAVGFLQDQTADGYVFRTDLRLRPDPGSSAIAVAIETAENYYETYGQNWERAAFIKARVAAGDKDVGASFLKMLQPFIWRRYLDFAAIEDIHSIKRQIHAVKGGANITFEGHDLKLGRGGIREIEFFVQTQQLILGGREAQLREPTTLGALQALVDAGHQTSETAKTLTRNYLFLRRLEHRIQMVADQQTHKLPKEENEIESFIHFCGYEDSNTFRQRVLEVLTEVHDIYADLFIEHDALSADVGSLVFTGVEDDPNTLEALESLGFENPSFVSSTIRGWHSGGMRVSSSERGRGLLTQLVPAFLQATAKATEPDRSFRLLNDFLRDMPSGVQIFSLFLTNPDLIDFLVDIGEIAPRLSQNMARQSRLVETLFLSGGDDDGALLVPAMAQEVSFEEGLDQLRRVISDARFKTSIQLVTGQLSPKKSGEKFTQIANMAVQIVVPLAWAEMERLHGPIEGEVAVIGMGRMGAGTLTATSDLDLVFVYDVAEHVSSKGLAPNGEKALDGITWFTRLIRRLVTGLSIQTSEGGLYEIDMQLRPSGGAGPAAVKLQAFEEYYENDAWTWEFMALTKATILAGGSQLTQKLETRIADLLTRSRDSDMLKADILDMRKRLLSEKPAKSPWDVKRLYGGLTDIDFVCQFLSLKAGDILGRLPQRTSEILPKLAEANLMESEDKAILLKAYALYDSLIQFSRASIGGIIEPEVLSMSQRVSLASYCGTKDIETLGAEIESRARDVAQIFEKIVGKPI